MRARGNGLPACSVCGERCSGYDTQPASRRFNFIPLWMIPVVLVYTMRRVNCPTCGVKVERVPWAEGKSPLTTDYQWFLAGWARRMSWKEVATCFEVSWDHVCNSVKHAVSWGLSHRNLDGIESIGVDEVQWKRGHKYQTLVYQIDQGCKRLLWIGPDRTAKTLLRFFRFLGKERSAALMRNGAHIATNVSPPGSATKTRHQLTSEATSKLECSLGRFTLVRSSVWTEPVPGKKRLCAID